MNKKEALKFANEKFDNEHPRWNTWAIFFFGSIISIITLWGQFKSIIPSYTPCIVCAIVSLIWVFVALGIRRVSTSWMKVIEHIEASESNKFKPNELYMENEKSHQFCKDFFHFSLFRVTKVLTYFGVVSFILFIVLGWVLLKNPTNENNQINNLPEMIDSINVNTKKMDNIHQQILTIERKLDNIEKNIEEYNKANSADAKKPRR